MPFSKYIIHCSHHLSSHWLKTYSQLWETAQPTDYSLICTYRSVNNLWVARAMHDFQEQCSRWPSYFSRMPWSGIIKVSVSIISLSLRLRLITLTSTLIIPDITKTSSNNCLLFWHNFVAFCCFRSSFRSEMKAMVGSSAKRVQWREPSQRHMSK